MFATKRLLTAIGATVLFVLTIRPDARADLEVVASIKPIHSLVAGVMGGDLGPRLILDGPASPHSYSLRPSGASTLGRADLIFWVGHNLESFLEKPIDSLGGDATVITLMEAPDVELVSFREGTTFERHTDDHAGGEEQDGRPSGEGSQLDPHIWLDPANTQALVRAITHALIAADPEHAPLYAGNAQSLHARIEKLSAEIDAMLEPVRAQPFFVFHDGYRYMERRYGLAAAGSITLSPEIPPGAGRVRDIRDKIRTLGATCVFTEPQFPPTLVNVVTAGTDARTGVLDPLGTGLPAGPDLYFTLMRNMAAAMRACLSPTE
jgi:zinc transport system substrate-binding protein